jgi:hypothetical protein
MLTGNSLFLFLGILVCTCILYSAEDTQEYTRIVWVHLMLCSEYVPASNALQRIPVRYWRRRGAQ